jgi:hypothetical protein
MVVLTRADKVEQARSDAARLDKAEPGWWRQVTDDEVAAQDEAFRACIVERRMVESVI